MVKQAHPWGWLSLTLILTATSLPCEWLAVLMRPTRILYPKQPQHRLRFLFLWMVARKAHLTLPSRPTRKERHDMDVLGVEGGGVTPPQSNFRNKKVVNSGRRWVPGVRSARTST